MATKSKKKLSSRKPRLKHAVCKPCWELKYCPYGPLVEFFPLPGISLNQAKKSYRNWINAVRSGSLKTEREIHSAIESILCLSPRQLAWVSKFRVEELQCSIFGHVCPVFFTAESFTETKEDRRTTRNVPRDMMLKVLRRDGQVCRACHKNVPDDKIEFDHIIPHSRGGPTSAENIRILCRECNRKKKATLNEILADDPIQKWGGPL